MNRILVFLASLFGLSCGGSFVETTTPTGIPNLEQVAPRLWRMGQPPSAMAWAELGGKLGSDVVVVKLDDEVEGDDSPAEHLLGWTVVRIPLPPEDDKPWTVFEKPSRGDVQHAVSAIVDAHAKGHTVVWHCVHGRDRTSLIAALVGQALWGWTKEQMEADMTKHGFRWILPDLAWYFATEVP